VLASGTTANGLLVSETDDEVRLKGDDALVRTFARDDIDEMIKQKISLMPADIQKVMSTQELADVVEFMQTLRKQE
jgi:putative heme-binding domain-containing protein